MTKEEALAPYYKQNKNGLEEWVDYADALKAMEEYSKSQAIEFVIHYAEGLIRYIYLLMENEETVEPSYVRADRLETRYNYFVENQSKNEI